MYDRWRRTCRRLAVTREIPRSSTAARTWVPRKAQRQIYPAKWGFGHQSHGSESTTCRPQRPIPAGGSSASVHLRRGKEGRLLPLSCSIKEKYNLALTLEQHLAILRLSGHPVRPYSGRPAASSGAPLSSTQRAGRQSGANGGPTLSKLRGWSVGRHIAARVHAGRGPEVVCSFAWYRRQPQSLSLPPRRFVPRLEASQ